MLIPVKNSQQFKYWYWYTSVFSALKKYIELVMAGRVAWGLVPMKDENDFIVK